MLTNRFWVYRDGFLQGPFLVQDLIALEWFSQPLMVCQDGDDIWRPASETPAIQKYLAEIPSSDVIAAGDYAPQSLPSDVGDAA